ncbi:glucosaminidase domain-containing protein [Clostridium oceanicum]|uniref:Mannosyl-glycoprotein endo-beta-N-acetylglucosamidase-like domain-containing protein n=1 Tax=Clostridium oceanicum TaxID=1543 RepID=A0ABP3UHQ0_9CLOT
MNKIKNYIKKSAFIITMIFSFLILFNNYSCYADDSFSKVDAHKTWTIHFNKRVDESSINSRNILVTDSNNTTVSGITFTTINNGLAVKVIPPKEGYKEGQSYRLTVTCNLKSLCAGNLKEQKVKLFSINKTEIPKIKTPIQGVADVTANQMASYVLRYNSNPNLPISINELAKIFLQEGAKEGIRGDIAFAQSIKETGFFRYGGQVLPEQNNYAGIGAINNSPTGKGAWFKDPREGVRAQIQHLKAYACREHLNSTCVDPRFNLVTRGIAPNWQDLDGKWAVPGVGYGDQILSIYNSIKGM